MVNISHPLSSFHFSVVSKHRVFLGGKVTHKSGSVKVSAALTTQLANSAHPNIYFSYCVF